MEKDVSDQDISWWKWFPPGLPVICPKQENKQEIQKVLFLHVSLTTCIYNYYTKYQ